MLSCLKLGGSFLDVGAHVGYYTLIGARALAERGCVHAFEPMPRSFALLKKNVESNRLENVVLNNAACWSSPGEVILHEANAINSGKSSVIGRNANSRHGPAVARHAVRAVTVDQYVARDEVDAVGFFDRVNVDDVRMVERGDGFCFSLEPGPALFVLG